MKIKPETAVLILDMMYENTSDQPVRTAIMEEGEFVEVNGEDYLGGNQKLDEIEDLSDKLVQPICLSLDLNEDNGVVCIPQTEGEVSVGCVLYTDTVTPTPIPEIQNFKLCEVVIETNTLPDFFMLDQDGFAVTLDIFASHQIDIPENHVRNDSVGELAEFALDLLGEAEDIQFLLIDHISPFGDIMRSLVSSSRAPEKTQSVFGFHGLQSRRKLSMA